MYSILAKRKNKAEIGKSIQGYKGAIACSHIESRETALPRLGLSKEEEGEHKEEEPQEAHEPASSSNRVNANGAHRSVGQV